MRITNSQGREFEARFVLKGERYGLEDRLINEREPMVEFYDRTYAGPKFGPLGQFVSRYNVDTLAGLLSGLSLDGGVPEWSVDLEALRPVIEECKKLCA